LVSRSGSAAAALAGVFFLVSNNLTLEPSLGPVDGGAWISRTVMGNQGFPPVAVKNGLAEGFPVFQVENHLQSLEFLPEALDALHLLAHVTGNHGRDVLVATYDLNFHAGEPG
jgi:hypothetical protein